MDAIQGVSNNSENMTKTLLNIIQIDIDTKNNESYPQNHTNNGIERVKESDEKEVKKITEKLNNTAASLNFSLNFQIHKKTGKIFVKVIDKNTNKVIREIPSKKMLDFLSKFEDAVGVLFDKRS